MLIKTLIAVLISYLFGCFNTGYYYTKIIYKKDIRELGSKVTGATNVGRLAGRWGFIITFFGDGVKGVLIVLLARGLGLAPWATLLAILMVLLGHIFPIQLRFQGGKGMSTIFGALLTYHPPFIIMLFFTCLLLYPFVRKYTITALFALFLFPLELFFADYSFTTILFGVAYAALIIYACRSNLKDYLKDKAYQKH